MRALKGLTLLFLIGALCLPAWGKDIDHQRGIEVRGGYNMYLDMADPNTFAENFTGIQDYSQTEFNKSEGAISGGLTLLYKSEPYFAWHIGFNFLSTDSATARAANAASQVEATRVFVKTVELFFSGNYYWNITPRFNLELGAGPSFYLSSMDREVSSASQDVYGESFYGAHGRAFGFKGDLGMEFFLSQAVSLKLAGGFRWAPVTRFKFFREIVIENGTVNQGEIAYWPDSFDTFEADFSGAFVDLGLRVYFDPAAPWNKYGE
jgi:hypothetical protein